MPRKRNLLPGTRFHSLTVLGETDPYIWKSTRYRRYLCECDCGNTTKVMVAHLRSGNTKSCGCLSRKVASERNRSRRRRVTSGEKFNRWTVLREAETPARKDRRVECVCECGIKKTIFLQALTSGRSRSCGCLSTELLVKRSRTHGKKDTPTYNIWSSLKQRCDNPSCAGYPRYGGRGITVCKRWRSFENFLKDMGERPTPKHTLDRKNNDGNYCKSNCRWTDLLTQNNNKSNTRFITLCGETLPQMEWCRLLGITKGCLQYRLANWSETKILNTPKGRQGCRKPRDA